MGKASKPYPENNAADIFTKNVTEYLFLKHTLSYVNHLADEKHHTYIMFEEEEEDEVDDHLLSFKTHYNITKIRNREDI
jgi:hypothetical protein